MTTSATIVPSSCDPHAEAIVDLYGSGLSVRKIAVKLSLSKSAVGRWIAGQTGVAGQEGGEYAGHLARARRAHAADRMEEALELIDSGFCVCHAP